uniref:Putative methyltransferase n=1 Tax=viral metagenome TaxID=1070528 RepID=A0A6H1ZYA8_9ZZZZ
MVKFTVVIPVKNEVDMIQRNLSSWCNLKPDELILCFDKPAPKNCVTTAKYIARAHNVNLRILEVEHNPKYKFQQAWIRRKGFREARNDVILTGDIDLHVYPSCLKAVELVGKDNVGLASLSKLRSKRTIVGRLRNLINSLIQKYAEFLGSQRAGVAFFTGLYALYRPYWLDSEDEEGIKRLLNPKYTEAFNIESWGGYVGEDTYLRNCMIEKHECRYLADVGAEDLGVALENTKPVQIKIGMKFAYEEKQSLHVLRHSLIHIRPYLLGSYIHTTANINGSRLRSIFQILTSCFTSMAHRIFNQALHFTQKFMSKKMKTKQYSLVNARAYWQYAPSSVGVLKVSSSTLLNKDDHYIKRLIEKSIEARNKKEGALVYRHRVLDWIRKEGVARILDFGCGLGQDGVYFSTHNTVKVTFCDIVKPNVDLTKRYSEIWNIPTNSIYINSAPEMFTYPYGFDMIFANGVLHHTPRAHTIVNHLKTSLKLNGLFICMLYTPAHFRATGAKTLSKYASRSEGLAPIQNPFSDYYTKEKAIKLFTSDFELLDYWTTHQGKFGWYVFRLLRRTT